MNFNTNKTYYLFLTILLVFNLSWAQTPPEISADGDQIYCPLSQINIVTDFNIIPGDDEIDAIFIQISENYAQGEDTLTLTNQSSHPNVTASWSSSEGKLSLTVVTASSTAYIDLIAAVKEVVFVSNALNPTNGKTFSITVDEKNYLPKTQHYYEYISAPGITWTEARDAAAALPSYYGVLDPYLATITSVEEAQICGEQAPGEGWIGGSDAAIEGTWRWVTGPEAGSSFFFGDPNGISMGGTTVGADYPYANWSGGEPNDWTPPGVANVAGQENYAHIYETGKWNDYPNSNTSIKGYIVEYGGMPGNPTLELAKETKISIIEISSTTDNFTCGPGTVSLSATATLGGTVLWFDSASGGNQVWAGEDFPTPTLTTTTTYYALASVGGCLTGERKAVIATVFDIPIISPTTDTTICGAGVATLTATASEGTISWYDALTGGNLLGTGTSFTPASTVNSTTTYYVDATENGCTTTSRTAVTLNVQYTNPPTATSPQTFCDIENATLNELSITGTSILWYADATGGTDLLSTTLLLDNTIYYASQTIIGCESPTRFAVDVTIFETVIPSVIIPLEECDTDISGSDTDRKTIFDLTSKETELLNGKNSTDFTIKYFDDSGYIPSSEISNPTTFENTTDNEQTIYVRIYNNIDSSCSTDVSFQIKVNALPIIQSSVDFKNCDEDGNPDGFTDFNLTEANAFITSDNSDVVTYYLSYSDADSGITTPLNPSPFNNANTLDANTVYARVENTFGCSRVSTIHLDVSVTSFPTGFNYNIAQCDADDTIDGLSLFDLTEATTFFLAELNQPNLSVHYYRNITDAQLEENEILPQNAYLSEIPLLEPLFVRVENDDNGDCFGIGEHLTLTVYPKPEFEVTPTAIVCLNLLPLTLKTFNANDIYTYQWIDESGAVISEDSIASITSGGIYTVIATSGLNCESFPQTVTVSESISASISLNDITITDDSENNSITIKTTNLGIGDYEFALEDSFGPYQDDPFFENVAAGIHTIYIRDKNSCGIAEIDVSVIGFPKFFTPNNDGENDTWQIKGVSADFYPTSLIYIFDRFGKLVAKIDPSSDGWNGDFNGKMLSSTDYWFSVQLIDENGNIREKRGHFSLIRR